MEYDDKEKERYGLFNGRRSADNYVKGWLKGIAIISGTCTSVILAFSFWVTLRIYEHEKRIVIIETTRYTLKEANEVADKIQLELRRIQDDIKSIQIPPDWFKEKVYQNTNDIRELQKKLK